MIFTRELVNKNIKFYDHTGGEDAHKEYDYTHLSSLVDAFKNCLLSKGATAGQTAVIGTQARIEQIALVLACSELGISIIIVGQPLANVNGKFVDFKSGLISKMFEVLLPVNFFITVRDTCTDKFEVFKHYSDTTIELSKETLDFTPNNTILATPNSVFLKCAARGETPQSAPKVVSHTHEFITALSKRNSSMFYGDMGMSSNLAHGSSPAVFFLPGFIAENVTGFHNYCMDNSIVNIIAYSKQNNLKLPDHMIVNYTHQIDEFFNSAETFGNGILYTLGLIRKVWVDNLGGKVGDIISIFGSSETSGPTLINRASYTDFSENIFRTVDDFYKLEIFKDRLQIKMPFYDTVISTGDAFIKLDESRYQHNGRNGLSRINDLDIDANAYHGFINRYLHGQLVVDTIKNNIYLVIWDETVDHDAVKKIDEKLRINSNGRHRIDSYDTLNYQDFFDELRGLNVQKIRQHFHNKL